MALYKRPGSKYYWMKFTFGGELVQQSTKCSNKKDAQTVESAYRTQLALGKIGVKPRPKAPSFADAAADFLKWSRLNHAQKPNSFRRVEFSCKPLQEFFGEKKVDRIEPPDVERYILRRSKQTSKKTGEPITRDTINAELVVLKTIFKRLVMSDVLRKSPAIGIKQLAKNERKFHVVSPDEEKIYLMSCAQPLRDVAALMLETGMRPTEIYTLKRQNVNLDKGFLQIEYGKTQSSNRRIWLSDKAADVLRRRADKFTGDFLFPRADEDGNPPTYPLSEQHRAATERINLKFRLYDLRHTFASRVLENGNIDLLTLAAMLGHSNLEQVMRYAHPSDERKNEAMRQMKKEEAKAV